MTVPGTFDTSARELIHAGLQNLDEARSLFRQLSASGFDAARCGLLLDALQHVCDPDVALRNLVDIVNAQVSQGRALDDIVPDDTAFRQLVAVLGVSDAMGKLMRFRPDLVQAAATDHCNSHLYNHDQRRAHVLESVGADPNDRMSPTATMDLADAATALRRTYRNQLAAIIAQVSSSAAAAAWHRKQSPSASRRWRRRWLRSVLRMTVAYRHYVHPATTRPCHRGRGGTVSCKIVGYDCSGNL